MAFEITPASVDDREGLRDFSENRLGLIILGDKGYTGESLREDMGRRGICLMSLKPSNYKKNWPTGNTASNLPIPEKGENSVLAA